MLPEGRRVLEVAAKAYGFGLHFDEFDFASCDYYLEHGTMLPTGWKEQLGGYDALFFGAVGWPEKVPDHISLWGSLVQFRRQFDQYVNRRPVRLMPGVTSPCWRDPGDIDFVVIQGEHRRRILRGRRQACSRAPNVRSSSRRPS